MPAGVHRDGNRAGNGELRRRQDNNGRRDSPGPKIVKHDGNDSDVGRRASIFQTQNEPLRPPRALRKINNMAW